MKLLENLKHLRQDIAGASRGELAILLGIIVAGLATAYLGVICMSPGVAQTVAKMVG
jgi:hypothetical protein